MDGAQAGRGTAGEGGAEVNHLEEATEEITRGGFCIMIHHSNDGVWTATAVNRNAYAKGRRSYRAMGASFADSILALWAICSVERPMRKLP